MNKQEQKQFRTALYEIHGKQYMDDKVAVERLYDADFKWVMSGLKNFKWSVVDLWCVWSRRFINTQQVCVECLGNSYPLEKWNDMIASLAPYDPEQLRKCLLAGMTPEMAKAYISAEFNESTFYSCLHSYAQLVNPGPSVMVRGTPATKSLLRGEREEVFRSIQADRDLHRKPSTHKRYDLLRLNWLIGDHMPIGGRVVRLKAINLASFPTYGSIHDERNHITMMRRKKDFINNPVLYAMATERLRELDLIIKHCDPEFEASVFSQWRAQNIDKIADAYCVPAHMLTDDTVEREYRTFTNKDLGEPYEKIDPAGMVTPKFKYPGGMMVFGSHNGNSLLRNMNTNYIVHDCDINGSVVSWEHIAEAFKKRVYFHLLKGIGKDMSGDIKNSFYNNKKQSTVDKNSNTNGGSSAAPTKQQKRKRIQEIEQRLSDITSQRSHCEQMDAELMRPDRSLSVKLFSSLNGGDDYHAKCVWLGDIQSITPATLYKLYKTELDEQEKSLNAELDNLIK